MDAIAHADDSAEGVRVPYNAKQIADFPYHLDLGGNPRVSLIP